MVTADIGGDCGDWRGDAYDCDPMHLGTFRIALVASALVLAVTFVGALGAAGTTVLASGLCTASCEGVELLVDGLDPDGSAHETCVRGHGCLGGSLGGQFGAGLMVLAAGVAVPALAHSGRVRCGPLPLSGATLAGSIDHPPRLFT